MNSLNYGRILRSDRTVVARSSPRRGIARSLIARLLHKKATQTTMTKRPFRLTYINARRPYGVAGFDNPSAATRMMRSLPIRGRPRSPTEASRAIHESYNGSQTNERGGYCPRDDRHILMFGWTDRGQRPQLRRPVGRRESRLHGDGIVLHTIDRRRGHDAGGGGLERLSRAGHHSPCHLELE